MNFIKKLWRGEVSFAVTFWVFGFVGTMVIGLVKALVFMTLVTSNMRGGDRLGDLIRNFNSDSFQQNILESSQALIPVLVFEFAYFLFMTGAIWNAANVYKAEMKGDTILPFLAKTVLFFGWMRFIWIYTEFARL